MLLTQWFLTSCLLLMLLILSVPHKELFENRSVSLYRSSSNESTFYKDLYAIRMTEFENDLLLLDRCIKVPMSEDLRKFISTAKFPIVSKVISSNSFIDVQNTILNELKRFYLKFNLKTFHGPVYVLIGQAPQLTIINEDCKPRSLTIQFNTNASNMYRLSDYTSIHPSCKNPPKDPLTRFYIHLLFPTYNKSGQFVYRSWENIKCHLNELLSKRSKDYPCELYCKDRTDLNCGCINQNYPYRSTCMDDTSSSSGMSSSRHNYWNLYVINSTYVNREMNANLETPFFSDSVHIQPYDGKLDYCGSNKPILEMNRTLNVIEIKAGSRYRITHLQSGKCLDDMPIRTTERIDQCVERGNQYWIAESVPGQEGFYLKNSLTQRYLKSIFNSMNQSVYIQTTVRYPLIEIPRWKYENYQLRLVGSNPPSYLNYKDNKLTLSTLSTIQLATNSLISASALPGILVGVGTDNQLYTKTTLTAPWTWLSGGCCVYKICPLKNGMILGVGTDNKLYSKQNLGTPWQYIHDNSCCIIDIAEMPDGSLIGVGTNNYLYIKPTLYDPWVFVDNNTCCIIAIHVMNNGTFLAVGTNNHLYTKSSLKASWDWVRDGGAGGRCCVKDITELPDGTLLGVGTNNYLYMKNNLRADWRLVDYNTCCVTGVAFVQNKQDIMNAHTKTWMVEPIQETQTYIDYDKSLNPSALRESILRSVR